MRIQRLQPGDGDLVQAAAHLFDAPPNKSATTRFLDSPVHHILIAYEGNAPAGFVSGVEVTHPDKGTEMFLYELGVDEEFRGRGVGKQLVAELAELANQHGCYGMWGLTDADNQPAMATYRSAGASAEPDQVVLVWTFDKPGGGTKGPSTA